MYMRFIVLLLLVYNGSVFSQQIECGDDYNNKKYTYKHFEITICDCRCTIQENVFFVKKSDSGLVYKVSGASRIVVNDRDLIVDEPAIRFFLSTKNKCSEDTVVKKGVISFLTLLPSENRQPCYEYSAYIDSIGNLQVLKVGKTVQNVPLISAKMCHEPRPDFEKIATVMPLSVSVRTVPIISVRIVPYWRAA